MNKNLHVVIAAAGKGSRSGLKYPKTLYKVGGKAIIHRIVDELAGLCEYPSIIVSPEGKKSIGSYIKKNNLQANLIVQEKARGMGDAILTFGDSKESQHTKDILLIWGDIPYINTETVSTTLETHFKNENTFTFPSRMVDKAYTIVDRNSYGQVIKVIETREEGLEASPGERDIGLFIFKKDIIIKLLRENYKDKFGKETGEHGFLYIIKYLAKLNFKVEALPIARAEELKSLNRLSDLQP